MPLGLQGVTLVKMSSVRPFDQIPVKIVEVGQPSQFGLKKHLTRPQETGVSQKYDNEEISETI